MCKHRIVVVENMEVIAISKLPQGCSQFLANTSRSTIASALNNKQEAIVQIECPTHGWAEANQYTLTCNQCLEAMDEEYDSAMSM